MILGLWGQQSKTLYSTGQTCQQGRSITLLKGLARKELVYVWPNYDVTSDNMRIQALPYLSKSTSCLTSAALTPEKGF